MKLLLIFFAIIFGYDNYILKERILHPLEFLDDDRLSTRVMEL